MAAVTWSCSGVLTLVMFAIADEHISMYLINELRDANSH